MIKFLISISVLLLLSILLSAYSYPTANFTVNVVDEKGIPIEGSTAFAVFSKSALAGEGWGNQEKSTLMLTDSDGNAEFADGTTPKIGYGAFKFGYYKSQYQYKYKKTAGIPGFRVWLPEQLILTVVLKRKINPVSLYARSYKTGVESLMLPVRNRPVGFDLIEGDWVIPYGKGTYKDLIFELNGIVDSKREFDLTLKLTFDNGSDGIQEYKAEPVFGSQLRLKHNAPTVGYSSTLSQRYARLPDKFISYDFPENKNYYFRVRSKVKENEVISAMYGKIHGNIRFTEDGRLYFTYYINPIKNDTNLEFEIDKNLFKNLPSGLIVSKP